MYKRNYSFRINIVEAISEIRSCIEISAKDIKTNTTDQYTCMLYTVNKVSQGIQVYIFGDLHPFKR